MEAEFARGDYGSVAAHLHLGRAFPAEIDDPEPEDFGPPTDDVPERIELWSRAGSGVLTRNVCFRRLRDGLFCVRNSDIFHPLLSRIYVTSRGVILHPTEWARIDYADIQDVSARQEKATVNRLIALASGGDVVVPVAGGAGRLRDA